MKHIILRNSNSTLHVEIVTDLPQTYDESMNCTVTGVNGLGDAESESGIFFKELSVDVSRSGQQFSISFFKQYAIDNNLLMDIAGGGTTENIIEASDIVNGLAISVGSKLPPVVGNTIGVAAVWGFDAEENSSSSLGGKYFKLHDHAGNGYYVWANCAGANLDPLHDGIASVQKDISGLTGVEVTLTTDDTQTEVAEAIELAIDALDDITMSNVAEVCTATIGVFGDTKQYGEFMFVDAVDVARQELVSSFSETTVGASAGGNYNWTPTVLGNSGTAPLSWTVTVGTLPAWASLNLVTGEISGTPNAIANTNVTLEVTDVFGRTDTQAITISIIA